MQLLDNRYRDYVGFPPLLRSGENDGKSFSDFYRASQIELFSALDNALSQKAQDTLTEFAAVKKAEVQLQTTLGNRKGQLGINLIGAFAERQNHGIGWQVRVYGAQQDGKGFNAGVFYRHITDNVLIGANAFVDYENHKLGNFYRYSIGGEAQNKYGSFAANYYVPITKEKRKDGGVIFSRKGYDAKLRLNIPNAKFLKAAVDYYNFGDEHGAESDDGFRYGAEAHLIPGLRLGLFYDDGGEELGGEVSYIHTIGEVQQVQTANEQWTPDLFAAVFREHSQRIVSVSVSVNVSIVPPSPIVPPMRTEIGRVASVLFTTLAETNFLTAVATTRHYILATLPPVNIRPPYVLTITENLGLYFALTPPGGSPAGVQQRIAGGGSQGSDFNFTNTGLRAWTITIVQNSIQIQSTLFAQAHTPFNIPVFSPPPMPQLPKLAFAAPVILARHSGNPTIAK